MATTTRLITGKDLALYVGAIMIGCADEVSVSREVEMNTATCKASNGWAESAPGTKSWSASASGVVKYYSTADEATNVGVADLKSLWRAGTKVTLKFTTNVAGDEGESGDAYIASIEETAGEGNATYSISFTGTGPLEPITVAA